MKSQSCFQSFTKSRGFTIIEALVAIALLSSLVFGIIAFQEQQNKANDAARVAAMLSALKARIVSTISSDPSWASTVQNSPAGSHLDCVGSAPGCTAFIASNDFSLFEADGSLVYASGPGNGFFLNGSSCSGGGIGGVVCPIRLRLQWAPSCSPSDVNCRYPLMQVSGVFTSTVLNLDLNKYSITLNRSPLSSMLCSPTPPACAGAIAVCSASGWICIAPNSPNCQGPATWIDALTSYGPCGATIPGPGVPHDTTIAIANVTAGEIGNASLKCIPGQPNSGFVVQAGATCAAAPPLVNGLCGLAGGGSFPNAAAVTVAGLCTAGTPTALAGTGPWTWSCNGAGGGTNAACTANLSGAHWAVIGSVFGLGNSGCTHAPVTSIIEGTVCPVVGETCSTLSPVSCGGVNGPCGGTIGYGGGMAFGGLPAFISAKCVNSLLPPGATVPDVLCTGAGVPAGPVLLMRYGMLLNSVDACQSDLATCTAAGQGSCLAPLADGATFQAICSAGDYSSANQCQSGVALCLSISQEQCVPALALGATHPADPSWCSGAPWDPVPGPVTSDFKCTSRASFCSAIGVRSCTTSIASGLPVTVSYDLTCNALSVGPFPWPPIPTTACTSGQAQCSAPSTHTCL
jgi:hypothetical protein